LSFLWQNRLASYSFKDENEMNLYGMIFKVNEPNTKLLYKAIAVLLQNNKTHCKGHKNIPESAIWEDYHTIPENNLLQYLRKTYSNDK
jgi:hypothetical protein